MEIKIFTLIFLELFKLFIKSDCQEDDQFCNIFILLTIVSYQSFMFSILVILLLIVFIS
ncbi:MAG: hypothetical protein WCG25_02300 [bacterium]